MTEILATFFINDCLVPFNVFLFPKPGSLAVSALSLSLVRQYKQKEMTSIIIVCTLHWRRKPYLHYV